MSNLNNLPADIQSKIFKINTDAEKEEGCTRTYTHLRGKLQIHTTKKNRFNADGTQRSFGGSDYEQKWFWINCVNCGKDTSQRKSQVYHACSECAARGKYRLSAPLELNWDGVPIIKNGKVKLVSNTLDDYCLFSDSEDEE